MNYIERQVRASERKFTMHWPEIRKLPSPLQGCDLYPITEDGNGRNARAAWLLDTDAKIDMLAHASGVGLFSLSVRVIELKDAFKPYDTITFRYHSSGADGEWQQLWERARAGAIVPSFLVSVQASPSKGLRRVSIVSTRQLLRAAAKRLDRSVLKTTKAEGVSFVSVQVGSLPKNTAWSFGRCETVNEPEGVPILDLLPLPYGVATVREAA